MTKKLDFQIGEKVVWTVGKLKETGHFLEDNKDGTCYIVINNEIITVKKSILKLDI